MTGCSNRMGFVVPTKDRPEDLRRMLASAEAQSIRPDQIVVVDGGAVPVEGIAAEFPGLRIDYVRVYPPSLSRQRNAGMARLRDDITLAGYLDDDLVLKPDALERMSRFWESCPADVGGASFNIVNNVPTVQSWVKTLFLIDNGRRGVVLRSGHNTQLFPAPDTTAVEWLCGGATLWRRAVVEKFQYDEWFIGTGFLEDLDYSFRVGKEYRLFIVGDACVDHLSPPLRRDINHLLGQWQVINRLYFVRKHRELSVLLCYWAGLGHVVLNLAQALRQRDSGYLTRAMGNLRGLTRSLGGRVDRLGGILKS